MFELDWTMDTNSLKLLVSKETRWKPLITVKMRFITVSIDCTAKVFQPLACGVFCVMMYSLIVIYQ